MTEYPSNSRTTPPPNGDSREKLEQVTVNPVIIKKKGLGRRIAAAFTGEDGKTVAEHVLWKVLIPAAKEMVYDAGQEALGRTLGIEIRSARRPIGSGGINYSGIGSTLASKVSYQRPAFMADPRQPEPRRAPMLQTTRGNVTIDDIVLTTRVEADEVINAMHHLLGRFQQVTFADVFDLVGVTGNYTDENFGWTNLDGARPHRTSDGYRLQLPTPIQLT